MSQNRYVIEDQERMSFRVNREVLVSPAILEQEMRAIFDKSWIYLGHGSEIRAPGAFRTRQIGLC